MSRDNKQIICPECGSHNCEYTQAWSTVPHRTLSIILKCHCYHCSHDWEA
jgi:C4-type Zn-finger protein